MDAAVSVGPTHRNKPDFTHLFGSVDALAQWETWLWFECMILKFDVEIATFSIFV